MRRGDNQTKRRLAGMAHNEAGERRTVAQLIEELRKLDQDAEVALLSHTAMARPPHIEKVEPHAWNGGEPGRGFADPQRAYLIRPAREIV